MYRKYFQIHWKSHLCTVQTIFLQSQDITYVQKIFLEAQEITGCTENISRITGYHL